MVTAIDVWMGKNGDTWIRVPAGLLQPEQECVAHPEDQFKAQAGTLLAEDLVYVLVYDGELVQFKEEPSSA